MKRKYELGGEINADDIPVTNHETIEDTKPGSVKDESESSSDSRSNSPPAMEMGGYSREAYLKYQIGKRDMDLIEIGKTIVLGTVDQSLSASKQVDRAAKQDAQLINLENLVHGLAQESTIDQKFSMVGSSLCFNIHKTSLKSAISSLNAKSSIDTSAQFSNFDFNILNLQEEQIEKYQIQAEDPFLEADLAYIFGLLTFRDNAKLLNKTKQFIKAYFVVSCRPRCFIWRYTLRKSGATHKKSISHLPHHIMTLIVDFLLDLCGIGRFDVPYLELERTSPFFYSLGAEDPEGIYQQLCESRDELVEFFKNAITDCLNEIREMPYLLDSGVLSTPLRGRSPSNSTITWKQYENLLKCEIENPTPQNIQNRVNFEHAIFTQLPVID
ncbi:unnamed protein product [Caenorhabditis angaria]|uniref:Uncharacterized protein n=1 Tax=Caenorhabditis angaria TaxID=860376 RepID=A0A9P1N0N4_9PELO|nr:unnamed protein product [Caenorhabditis angaria]